MQSTLRLNLAHPLTLLCLLSAFNLSACAISGDSGSERPATAISTSVSLKLSSRPRLQVIPGFGVYYGVDIPSGYFFFDRHYWVFEHDAWYRARFYNGPWRRMPDHRVPDRLWRLPPPHRPPNIRPRKP
ncbi:MAG: hypothetical protein ACO3OV_01505 [Steroidobacteraceae bacterium]